MCKLSNSGFLFFCVATVSPPVVEGSGLIGSSPGFPVKRRYGLKTALAPVPSPLKRLMCNPQHATRV